jgi:hypothetical protein
MQTQIPSIYPLSVFFLSSNFLLPLSPLLLSLPHLYFSFFAILLCHCYSSKMRREEREEKEEKRRRKEKDI